MTTPLMTGSAARSATSPTPADGIRYSAIVLDNAAGELASDADASDIRLVAVSIRSTALSLLLAAASLTSKAERLDTFAEIRELG